jgi:hypothetical protein
MAEQAKGTCCDVNLPRTTTTKTMQPAANVTKATPAEISP